MPCGLKQIHNGLKDFYSRLLCGEHSCIEGKYNLNESQFIKPPVEKFTQWLELISGEIEYELLPLRTIENCDKFIQSAFKKWMGDFDMGRRAMIGSFYTDVGDFLLLFNNDTGSIEWNDPGYGHFEVYEDNPYGIFARDIYEFYDKLSTGMF